MDEAVPKGIDDRARAAQLRDRFRDTFGREAEFVSRAPGRVNLIGEHTDYNGGFVLPAAIDRTVLIAVCTMPETRNIEVASVDYGNRTMFSLDNIKASEEEEFRWTNYMRAVAWALGKEGHIDLSALPGAQMLVEGNVPLGSGLSSSAAIEVAAALSFTRMAGVTMERDKLALVCQKAENEFVGVNSGIMDQFISALGEPDSALLVDTRSLQYRAVPLGLEELGYRVVAVDSAVPRTLAATAYNQRRAECETAVRTLAPLLGLEPGAQLRDISWEQLEENRHALEETLYRRARHVVSEDRRTLDAVALMDAGLGDDHNLERFGKLLYASHASLRDDYEVSSPELDLLVELARESPGVAGARMTGAGFGGCTVNIVQESALADFTQHLVESYRSRAGRTATVYVCKAVEGGTYLE